jgi:DNA polymerase-1
MTPLFGMDLFMEGINALSKVESWGFKIDEKTLMNNLEKAKAGCLRAEQEILNSKEGKLWQKIYGSLYAIQSNDQRIDILFNELGYDVTKRTDKGAEAVDKEVLAEINTPFTKALREYDMYMKIMNTYLNNIKKETTNGILHPFFNLHTVDSFRSSGTSPNFQNMPIRDKVIGSFIRTCFVPRENHQIVEIDYSGAEVTVASFYHKDPTMISYITDPNKDMHRDCACDCFMLTLDEVTKEMRQICKGKFVFASFYGSYFKQTAPDLWKDVCNPNLLTKQGKPLKSHLAEKGIITYNAFEEHIRDIEEDFWNVRFGVYGKWKKDWYNSYVKKGYVENLTGFKFRNKMSRNQVINFPVQSTAFHLLLWSLIQMVDYIEKNNLQTRLVGQIHDSLVNDIHCDELKSYLKQAYNVMCVGTQQAYDFMLIPLEIEADIAPAGASWYEKEGMSFDNLKKFIGV